MARSDVDIYDLYNLAIEYDIYINQLLTKNNLEYKSPNIHCSTYYGFDLGIDSYGEIKSVAEIEYSIAFIVNISKNGISLGVFGEEIKNPSDVDIITYWQQVMSTEWILEGNTYVTYS